MQSSSTALPTRIRLDTIEQAVSYVNGLGDYELSFAHSPIAQIENLNLTHNAYRSLNFRHCHLSELAHFPTAPVMTRLETLYCSNNAIHRLDPMLALTLPSLRVLDLENNAIATFEQIQNLRGLRRLEHLILQGNPIADRPDYRSTIIAMLPHLRTLDYQAIPKFHHLPKSQRPGLSTAAAPPPAPDRTADKAFLLQQLTKATTVEEIQRIQLQLTALSDST